MRSAASSAFVMFGLLAASPALAQVGEDFSHTVDLLLDSGWVENNGSGNQPAVVYSTDITVEEARWLRLNFGASTLSGDPAGGGAYLLLTSLEDGAAQILTSEGLEHWANTSGFFNGGSLLLELYAFPGTGPSRVLVDTAIAGDPPISARSLCGVDDRLPSNDPRGARTSGSCSTWLINDMNHQFLTAGHCGVSGGTLVYFNVPLSDPDGSLNFPPIEDQYPAEGTSVQGTGSGIGNDWRYYGVNPNSNTGLQPYQAQGASYTLANAPANSPGQLIRVTGYGTTGAGVPPEWNQAQKTHVGPMVNWGGTAVSYQTDTTGGNSGSPIIHENTGNAIGIHTHGGCSASAGNFGTAFQNAGLQAALANPLGVCRSGIGNVAPPLYAVSDLANNFGTLNRVDGQFAKVSQAPGRMSGLTFNPYGQVFYSMDGAGNLFSADAGGAFTLLGNVAGLSGTVTGLAYDAQSHYVYAMVQAGGQLHRFTIAGMTASLVGVGSGGSVGGLEFDASTGTLYGIDDTGGSKLVTLDTSTGAKTTIGALGAGINDCNGLGWVDLDGELYTINAATDTLMRVNKATGVATVVGGTGGAFGSTYGIAAITGPGCVTDLDGDLSTGQGDLALVLASYDTCAEQVGWNPVADVDGDGCVGQADLARLLADYGNPCP